MKAPAHQVAGGAHAAHTDTREIAAHWFSWDLSMRFAGCGMRAMLVRTRYNASARAMGRGGGRNIGAPSASTTSDACAAPRPALFWHRSALSDDGRAMILYLH